MIVLEDQYGVLSADVSALHRNLVAVVSKGQELWKTNELCSETTGRKIHALKEALGEQKVNLEMLFTAQLEKHRQDSEC